MAPTVSDLLSYLDAYEADLAEVQDAAARSVGSRGGAVTHRGLTMMVRTYRDTGGLIWTLQWLGEPAVEGSFTSAAEAAREAVSIMDHEANLIGR